jgi:hypothetical protein
MQVTPLPMPVLPNALPPDAVAKMVPHIQAQASAPLTQRAVDPSSKSERGNQSRTNAEKAKGGDGGDRRSGSVNIKV